MLGGVVRHDALRPLIRHGSTTAEVRGNRLVLDHLDRHQYRERSGVAEVRGAVPLVGISQARIGERADGTVDSPAVT